jgi:excisionase family DNA binding protein
MKTQKLYTPDEVADTLGYAAWTVRKWCREGEIDCVNVGGEGKGARYRIPQDALDAKFAALTGSDDDAE